MNVTMALCSALILGGWQCNAEAVQHQRAAPSARWVQEFYDWYVPIAAGDHRGPAMNAVLSARSTTLAPELLRMLRLDSAAQSGAIGETVGLDFDPFLGTQDPCEHYVVGAIARMNGRYRASVFSVCSGRKSEAPELAAEITRRGSRWVFTNFYYLKEHTDLASVLEALRRDRARPR